MEWLLTFIYFHCQVQILSIMLMRIIPSISLLFLFIISLAAFGQPPASPDIQSLLRNFNADRGSLERYYYISSSPERRQRMQVFCADYAHRLEQVPFDNLSVSDRVDYILFRNQLAGWMEELKKEEQEYAAAKSWLPFADSIYAIERPRRRGAIVSGEKTAVQFSSITRGVAAASTRLNLVKAIEKPLADRAESSVRGMQEALKSVVDFYSGYDPQFTWWTPKPYHLLDSSLNAYAQLIKAKGMQSSTQKPDSSGIHGSPIGREEVVRQLKAAFIPYSPEELMEIANKEFAWCDAEMLKASKEMGFGNDWKAAIEKVKNSYVPAGEQPAAILKLYNESIEFIKSHDLVTIPPIAEETWRMSMMAPERQLVSPFFLGGEEIIISYPTNTMDEADKRMSMRGNNPHFSRATVHHELIAGHHLQMFMNERYKPYRNFTPFWIEGWALYWEFILWDMGFPKTPEDRIGMLFWRMHRCARILFSLNYHMNKWSPQQCIDFLVDRVGHERANAAGEVRRSFEGGYGPLYQLAYMVGGLQFYQLKKDLVDTKKMTYREFHDRILQENNLPVEMVRAILTNQVLKKDFTTNWKFYEK
jgi:uncharacterized protein (DUF885 family)